MRPLPVQRGVQGQIIMSSTPQSSEKKISFERKLMEEILPEPILYSTGVFPIRIFAMLQTLKNANEVFVSYLRDHPGEETKYDLVIRTRPDLYFYSDIDLMQTLDP